MAGKHKFDRQLEADRSLRVPNDCTVQIYIRRFGGLADDDTHVDVPQPGHVHADVSQILVQRMTELKQVVSRGVEVDVERDLRTPMNNIEYFPPNFEGLVLGGIDADFCK